MLEKFSIESQKMIAVAESLAFDLSSSFIGKEHLFLAFLKARDSLLSTLLLPYGITYEVFLKELKKKRKEEDVYFMEYTTSFKVLLERAVQKAKENKEERVSLESLAYVLVEDNEGMVSDFLTNNKVKKKEMMAQMAKAMKKHSELENIIDLHELSKTKKDPLIGREKELDQLIRALIRRNKPNALLVGAPGIGKTAIVEELAYLLSLNKVKGLENKRIYELDLSSVVGGTKYRGEFEEKLKKIIRKVKEDGNAILFIDEIHNIIKAGGAEGAIDASNILKPYLSRGEIQLIGATTTDEYHATIAKDKALSRRFQLIKVDPSTASETEKILQSLVPIYESYYQIKIPRNLVHFIVDLADEYLPARSFPDKAIDILDNSSVIANKTLTRENIVRTMESFYNVTIDIQNKAIFTKNELDRKLIGQKSAIMKIYRWLRLLENGARLPSHPLLVLFFAGPSGVGKSEASKIIAECFLKNKEAFIRLDMASYQDSPSLNKLIGSAPGYSGYDSKPTFIKRIQAHPNAVVLLDEIDKAHVDVCDFFLSIFDEGYFYDATQEKVDCSNIIFIMTSNQGFGKEESFSRRMHFHVENGNEDIYTKLSSQFRLEFLNRLDDIILFDYFDEEAKKQLIHQYLMLYQEAQSMEIAKEIHEEDVHINDTDLARFGARYVRRAVIQSISELLDEKEKIQ